MIHSTAAAWFMHALKFFAALRVKSAVFLHFTIALSDHRSGLGDREAKCPRIRTTGSAAVRVDWLDISSIPAVLSRSVTAFSVVMAPSSYDPTVK